MPTKVKICCIGSHNEAALAIQYGASAIGLVGHMPSGPGVITDTLIREIALEVPGSVATFLLTSETSADSIISHHRATNTSTIQIVDLPEPGTYKRLRSELPGVDFVQVIHVIDEISVNQALAVAPEVDALLLDSGNPNLEVKQLGGTGRVHNWDLSQRIVNEVQVPVYLAGGLNATNVNEALEKVNPYGIDLCSGVRTAGRLDESKLSALFRAIG